jgi:hypothetical protein
MEKEALLNVSTQGHIVVLGPATQQGHHDLLQNEGDVIMLQCDAALHEVYYVDDALYLHPKIGLDLVEGKHLLKEFEDAFN